MNAKNFFASLAFAGWLAGCGNLSADPLNNWHWRNPLPNGNPQLGAQALIDIIFTNGTFFAVGNSGVVDTSIDTTNWTQNVTATTNQLSSIIYADGKFVAVGDNGSVETSSDGTNWVRQNSGTTSALYSVAYGNGKFVAVGGVAIASSDAVNWSPAVSGFPGALCLAGNNKGFVALNGVTNVYFSTDGTHWTTNFLTVPVTGFVGDSLTATIVTATTTNFIIGGFIYVSSGSADMFMFSSSDGTHWTTSFLGNSAFGFSGGFGYNCFIQGGSELIAHGTSGSHDFLQYSTDGINWTQTNINLSALFNIAGAYGNGSYVILNSQFTATGTYVSRDSLNWTKESYTPPAPVGSTSTFNSIAYSNGLYVVASSNSFVISTNDAVYTIASNTPSLSSVVAFNNNFVGVGSNGQIYQSTNGFSWFQHNSGTANNLHGVAAGNNLLVAVGDNGAVQTSPTGIIWTSRASGTSLALDSVIYSNGLYVAVGQQGTVVISSDGVSWQPQDSTVLNNLLSVTYGSAGFLAVGVNSTMVTSPDGVNWTQQNPGNIGTFESVTFGNGYYLVTGPNALVLTSPDGVNWTSRNVGATGGPTLYGSGFLNGRFDVVGANGTILESDPVPPLFDIQIHDGPPTFTVFATPGITFRIQSCTNLAAPVWKTVATFNNASAITPWTDTGSTSGQCYYRTISP